MALEAICQVTEPLLSAEEMKAADAHTIASLGVPGIVLMEHAGRAVADLAEKIAGRIRKGQARKAVVLCGPGNNGGDGWVCARHLACKGMAVAVIATRTPHQLAGDAKTAALAWLKFSEQAPVTSPALTTTIVAAPEAPSSSKQDTPLLDDTDDLSLIASALAAELSDAAVCVDALFGIGLTRPLSGAAAAIAEVVDDSPCRVVAVDLPSGLPTTGATPAGPFIKAHHTVTFFAQKVAHAAEPTKQACGVVTVVDISIRSEKSEPVTSRVLRTGGVLQLQRAPKAGETAVHKGSFGHVGVLAGAPGTDGAARLSARAALRAGAGFCTLLERPTDERHPADLLEVMQRRYETGNTADIWRRISAAVAGPGLGTDEESTQRGIDFLKARQHRPAVVDADLLRALFATKATREVVNAGAGALVFTPHPGEAAGVLSHSASSWSIERVQADRMAAATALVSLTASDERVVWVLKGAVPLVAWNEWRILVPGNNPALAVAGSGDVLAGAIAAQLAKSDGPQEAFAAAIEGCRRHQAAGARLQRGALASEIADALVGTDRVG